MIKIEYISKIVHGELLQLANNDSVSELLIDSRLLLFPTKTVFFAIKTNRNDGHFYIADLYEKKVRNFVISDVRFPINDFPEANFILVENVVNALQMLAVFKRKQLHGMIVGITGSNGKTIVKEWSKQLLEPFCKTTASPKSYNSQIGVPLSIWQAQPDDVVDIFEAGISQPCEMQHLEQMIQPTIGVMTNIGSAHSENFVSIEQKIHEKLKLFEHAKTLIFCSDQSLLYDEIQLFAKKSKVDLFSWGHQKNANIFIEKEERTDAETVVHCWYENRSFEIKVPFTDAASIENVMHCIALTVNCGIDIQKVIPCVRKLCSVALRLEMHKAVNKCVLINDSYNLDLDSLKIALDFLKQQSVYLHKTLILSDIPQSDKSDKELYQSVLEMITDGKITRFIGIGSRLMSQKKYFPLNSLFFGHTQQFIEAIPAIHFSNEAILLKGARSFQFEKISNALQKLTHETVLEINLSALIHNLNYYQSLAKPAKMMAMVKAFAYGSGSAEVANILQYHGIDYLCVAYIDEGVELRKSGITLPIMIMNPEPSGFEDVVHYDLEPEIYNFNTLNLLEDTINNKLFYRDSVVRFHIKLDTGMHRLGFVEADLKELISRILQMKNGRVQSVFTHFACSDDPQRDDFSHRQLEKFERMSRTISESIPYSIMRHISNTAAITRFPEARFDMVRLGIGLYGVSSMPEEQNKLEVVNCLYSVISQIKLIPKGESVGYSKGFETQRDTRAATIPIGYADGLHRSLKNRGKVFINNHLCPLIGNICMDMCMADITDIEAKEGDKVEIFGRNNPVSQVAEQAGTIPYELFTGISPRVKRVYVQE